jgi:hypothetical protein
MDEELCAPFSHPGVSRANPPCEPIEFSSFRTIIIVMPEKVKITGKKFADRE